MKSMKNWVESSKNMSCDDTKFLLRFAAGLLGNCSIERNQSYQSFKRG